MGKVARENINEGWEERVDELCKPENFRVSIYPANSVEDTLTEEEYRRTGEKLNLVAEFAAKLAAAMLKGTLKYNSDNWSVETWLAEEEDEEIDRTNYRILRQHALRLAEYQRGG